MSATMQIQTTRFGELEMEEGRLIRFPDGMIGFPDHRTFVLLEHKPGSPFMWLQSTENPDLAFVIMNPQLVHSDYLEDIPIQDRDLVAGENGQPPLVFAVVTIPAGAPEKMTVNLLGPVVIDVQSRTGRQVILANSDYSTRHPVVQE